MIVSLVFLGGYGSGWLVGWSALGVCRSLVFLVTIHVRCIVVGGI